MGGVLRGSRKPLQTWGLAYHLIAASKVRRLTIREFQAAMGFSYATAWDWYNRITAWIEREGVRERHIAGSSD